MWKQLLSAFRSGGLHQEAFDEALLMLQASHGMHRDAVAALRGDGVMVADIYDRDRHLNKYERSVRRKILTHLTVSPSPDVNMGLVITAIVIDIERIGDYTKNIVELAAGSPEPFDGGELNDEFLALEEIVEGMFRDILPALQSSDDRLARKVLRDHKNLSGRVERDLQLLRSDQVLKGHSGRAVTAALYLRYLKRVSAHLKNVATSVVNPYHRIGYKEKRKKGEAPLDLMGSAAEGDVLLEDEELLEDLEPFDEDETRD
jgi:phosphate transport system protein